MQTKSQIHGGRLLASAVQGLYNAGQTDYSLEPLVRVDSEGIPIGRIYDSDAVIFCCRRGEREVELTEAFTDPEFAHFSRPDLANLNFVILTLYHEKFKNLPVAFALANIQNTLGETVSQAGLRQLHCAEAEKFAHVTFFLNGGNNQPFPGETDIRVPSLTGIPFDQVPQLSLPAVTEKVIEAIQDHVDFIVTNFANGDVIGHTASREAKLRCAEVVDAKLGRVVAAAAAQDYAIAITADHGNLEVLTAEDGSPHVSHTTNPAPFIMIDPRIVQPVQVVDGSLADIAPTILAALGISIPQAMTGANLATGHAWRRNRRVLLIILDGWGMGNPDADNPIHLANTPVWDQLTAQHKLARLQAAGEAVGLKAGKAGNSEAGHMNIGAGRVVLQDDVRLDRAMEDGSFFTNEIFLKAMDGVKQRKSNLHLIGLLTEKSSHGSIDYPLALLKLAKERGVQEVFLHIIFDGRSTPPGSAPALLGMLEDRMDAIGLGQIVTGMGRSIALDRNRDYGKIKRAFDALVLGVGTPYSAKDDEWSKNR